ncbi:hypothetical protein E8D37_03985 [Nocardioides sp. GY 10127]|nr:hypothetical protein E8D37_03985 [Nocardioides sp. GY 10127]
MTSSDESPRGHRPDERPRGVRRGLAVLALGGLAVSGFAACVDDSSTTATDTATTAAAATTSADAATSGSASATPTTGSTTAAAEASKASDSAAGETSAAAVYWVGSTPQGDRLYREFESVTGEPAAAAVQELLTGTPADPDYRSPFDAGTVSGVSDDGSTITVTLADDALSARPSGTSAKAARLAVQAVVYTVQGALQERLPVVVQDGSGATTLYGVDTAGGVSEGAQASTLALVNLTTPSEGATLSGTTLSLTGVANAYEATVPWAITDADGDTVLDGFVTADGWGDKLYPFSKDLDVSSLPAGTYTVEVASNGGEGETAPTTDTRTFTIG